MYDKSSWKPGFEKKCKDIIAEVRRQELFDKLEWVIKDDHAIVKPRKWGRYNRYYGLWRNRT